MAKQRSIIKLEGTIGDISFYKSKDGYLAREYSPLSAERIASDPKFQRTRENGEEFGRAARAGKLLRKALKEVIKQGSDDKMVNRLSGEMVKVIQADQVSIRGKRNVLDGELELLSGFNFNANADLDTVLKMDFSPAIDRSSGAFSINFPAFDPTKVTECPAGSTHFELISCAASIDFEANAIESGLIRSAYLSCKEPVSTTTQLEITLSPNSSKPLFLVLGVLFYQKMNTQYYPLNNGAYNSLCIVKISGI